MWVLEKPNAGQGGVSVLDKAEEIGDEFPSLLLRTYLSSLFFSNIVCFRTNFFYSCAFLHLACYWESGYYILPSTIYKWRLSILPF